MKGRKVKYWLNDDEWLVAFVVNEHGNNVVDVKGWETRLEQGDVFSANSVPQRDKDQPGGHNWSPL